MPSWHYPRWRRILMQVTLWLALAATTVAAALLSRSRQRAMAVPLSQRVTVGAVTLRLPGGWAIARGAALGSTVVMLASESPDADPDMANFQPRKLIVRLYPDTQGAASAAEFLQHSGLLRGTMIPTGDDPADDPDNPATGNRVHALPSGGECSMAGTTGNLVKVLRMGRREEGMEQPPQYDEWIAAALVSGGRALVLQLDCAPADAGDTDADAQLIASIAAAVRVAAPAPAPAEGVERL